MRLHVHSDSMASHDSSCSTGEGRPHRHLGSVFAAYARINFHFLWEFVSPCRKVIDLVLLILIVVSLVAG